MGNRNGQASNQQFRAEEWQRKEELSDCQVWQSKLEAQLKIQSHDIYTQSTAQVERESRMFELRKRSPLLVSAYFLQLQPKEEFCSFHNRHSLFLQRVPIRLSDIEHVPYPDYLHLYDSCIKGYAQLARHVGYFIVDEGMVGINEQCVAKAWLSQDFASSKPFNTNINQEIMVTSLLDTLDRSIDVEDLPPNIPLVRDFLSRGRVPKTFDSLLLQFGDFVRIYNNAQVPIRLDCIDRVGGIAVIANREKSAKMGRSNVSNKRVGSQVKGSQVGGKILQNNNQTRSMALIQPINTLPNAQQNQVIYYPQQVYQSQVRNPVTLQHNGLRKSQITVLPSLPIAQNIQQFANQPQPIQYIQSVHTSQATPQQIYTHRTTNAPKFTVQVIPGKVYPQKSSTIFLSSSKAIPAASSQPVQTLDSIHPIIAHSQKDVIKEDQPLPQAQVHSLVNSENGNMRSYTVDEEKYSPDKNLYQRQTHQIGREDQELQSYLPHMQGTAVFRNVESIQEQEPDFNNDLMLSFNPANLERNLQEAALPVSSKQEEWKNQAHFTNSVGELSPRDEEPVIIEYANNQESLLQSANFGPQSYSDEAYNPSASIDKEQQPTLYNYGSYGQASYSNYDHNDGKSSLQLMRELAATRSLATQPSYNLNPTPFDSYSRYLASLTQQPQEGQIRQTGTFRL